MQVKKTQAKEEWINENPLRKWRKLHGYTQGDVGNMIGVSLQMVKHYEFGDAQPTIEVAHKIEELVGGDLLKDWNEWRKRRPTL